jgi:hypothetical protein
MLSRRLAPALLALGATACSYAYEDAFAEFAGSGGSASASATASSAASSEAGGMVQATTGGGGQGGAPAAGGSGPASSSAMSSASSGGGCNPCPTAGWAQDPTTCHCYSISGGTVKWGFAECSPGTWNVAITSQQETDFLKTVLPGWGVGLAWVGLRFRSSYQMIPPNCPGSCFWCWVDGEGCPSAYSSWSNDVMGDCVAIGGDGLWYARDCTELHPFICEAQP